jgi:hypothetical protein
MRIPESALVTAVFLTGILMANYSSAFREPAHAPAAATGSEITQESQ